MQTSVLEIDNLHTHFLTREGMVRAIEGLSLEIWLGEVLGVVGESGCGESVTAPSTLRPIPPRTGGIVRGSVRVEGQDLATLSEAGMRKLRGNRIAVVFQAPMISINPVHTIGAQISEAVPMHQGLNSPAARARATEMLNLVRIPDAQRRLNAIHTSFRGECARV